MEKKREVDKLHQARRLIVEYIREHKYLPHFFKEELVVVSMGIFDPIREYLGNFELLYRRTYAHKDELNEHGVPLEDLPPKK